MSDEFSPFEKGSSRGRMSEDLSIYSSGHMRFSESLMEDMDHPNAIRLYYKDSQIGFEPCSSDHKNAYAIDDNTVSIAGLLVRMGIEETPTGRYNAEYDPDAGIWVVGV